MTLYTPLFGRGVAIVLMHEGGLVDDPNDPGGLTNWGFALNRNPDLTAAQLRAMTQEEAIARYFGKWWQPYRWQELPVPLALKVFDCAVPDGPESAIRALQRACRAAGGTLKEDGVLGALTLAAAGQLPVRVTLAALKSELAAHFRLVAAANPKQSGSLPGWLDRAYEDLGGWDLAPQLAGYSN